MKRSVVVVPVQELPNYEEDESQHHQHPPEGRNGKEANDAEDNTSYHQAFALSGIH